MFRTISRAAYAVLFASALGAQLPTARFFERDPLHAPGNEVTVSLLTMGNGTDVWELFGHTAIWIHDNATGRDSVFNWGVFDRSQPNFIPRFLKGLMLYQMGGTSMGQLLYEYRYFNRSVTSQELDLSAAQKDSLLHIILVNARPENLQYRYDYFVDNCSTRPRDILDRVLGGQLRTGADSLTNTSYRWHTIRLMQGDRPLVLGVHLAMGEPGDRPITKWQTMFLPKQLHDWVATRQVKDSAGATRPLVKSERVLFRADRPPEAETAPSFVWLWIPGLILAGLFAWLGVQAQRGVRAARIAAAIVYGIWALVFGLLGTILTLLWTVTDHRFAHANENLLLVNPLWLALAVLLPLYVLRGRAGRATRILVQTMAALAGLAVVAHLVTLSRQDNLAVIGLMLPVSLALAFVVRRLERVR